MTIRRKLSRIAVIRRRALIEAAITSIARVGFNAVTVAAITDEAGLSRGIIGHYFGGKDDLLLEAIEAISADLSEATVGALGRVDSTPLEKLHAIVRASFTAPAFSLEKAAVWISFVGVARWQPEFQKICGELWRDYRRNAARLIYSEASSRGLLMDAEMAALGLTQLIEGLWSALSTDPTGISSERAEATVHMYVDLLFDMTKHYPAEREQTKRKVG